MPKQKKSFFQRLTGITNMDNDPDFDIDEERDNESFFPQELRVEDTEETPVEIHTEPEEAQLTVDVYQTTDDIVIQTIVAGVRPEDIDIAITRQTITVKGSRPADLSIQEQDYYHQELFWGPFSRTVMLPQEVEPDKAIATEKNGLLTIKIPKIDKYLEKRLRIKSEK